MLWIKVLEGQRVPLCSTLGAELDLCEPFHLASALFGVICVRSVIGEPCGRLQDRSQEAGKHINQLQLPHGATFPHSPGVCQLPLGALMACPVILAGYDHQRWVGIP